MSNDIVCCLTPPGVAAIAVIGLRGATVWSKLAPFFSSARTPQLSRQGTLFRGKLQDGDLGDEVILSLCGDEQEQIIEVQTHGGPGVVQWLLDFAQNQLSCQLIHWNEWLDSSSNSRWPLLPLAITKRTAAILLDQCQGAFDRTVDDIQQRLQRGNADKEQLLDEVKKLRRWESLGAHLFHPWRVVLAGPPNVGKSSLFNALLGFERAITSPHPGTTRDLVEATLAWKGYPIEMIDTAGLRDVNDPLEAAGIERATQAYLQADAVLWLVDLSQDQVVLPMHNKTTFLIGTKSDLPRKSRAKIDYAVSATIGEGLQNLLDGLLQYFLPEEPEPGQGMPITEEDRRQLATLEEKIMALSRSADAS